MRLNRGLEAGVLLVQGVIAGLTLASMYTMALADSLESFVAAYEVREEILTRVFCPGSPSEEYPPLAVFSIQ